MSYAVDFKDVSTVGLESSPVASTGGSARARGAVLQEQVRPRLHGGARERGRRRPSAGCTESSRRNAASISRRRPLEATCFRGRGTFGSPYVFYESGLSINVMYTIDDAKEASGRVQALRRDGHPRAELASQFKFATAEIEASRDHPRLVLRLQERLLIGTPWRAPPARISAPGNTDWQLG